MEIGAHTRLSVTTRQTGKNIQGNFAGARRTPGKRQSPLTLVAVRALFGIKLLGGHAKHVVALDAHTVQHRGSGLRGGPFLRFARRRRVAIHSRAFYHAVRESRCRALPASPTEARGIESKDASLLEKKVNLLIDFRLSIRCTDQSGPRKIRNYPRQPDDSFVSSILMANGEWISGIYG